jgi:two-component system, sensor histidine kinase PdtaS
MLCYDKKTDEEINLYLYLKKLTDTIIKSFDSKVAIGLKYSDALIKNDYAISVGLIINELVMNSVKHSAADADDKINIEISFEKKQNILTIYYCDDGKGFNYDEIIKDSEYHLGLFLIKTLVEQYHGKLEYHDSKYPEFIITLLLKQ